MPNWCENKLTVKGPPNELASFVQQAEGYPKQYKKLPIYIDVKKEDEETPKPEKVMLNFHSCALYEIQCNVG